MQITQEFFTTALQEIQTAKQLNNSFLHCMHQYYLHGSPERYNNANKLTDFNLFVRYFDKWLNMPVSYGTTDVELFQNQQFYSLDVAIQKTITYFNKIFNITK